MQNSFVINPIGTVNLLLFVTDGQGGRIGAFQMELVFDRYKLCYMC